MAKSVIVWIFIASFFSIHLSVCTGETKKSKACFGNHGLACAKHSISCSSYKKIAIYDAYYTSNAACAIVGIPDCVSENPDSLTEHGHHRFNNTEMMSLYKNCSTATRCVYYAPRRQPDRAFSILKYRCVDNGDFLNISKGSAKDVSHVTLFHKDTELSSSTVQNNTYMCSFTSNLSSTSISMYVLDARLRLGTPGQCLSQLSYLHGNYIAASNCSAVFQPFERLNVTRQIPLHIYFKDTPRLSARLIWLLVNASNLYNVTCETVEQTTGTNSVTTVRQVPSTNYSILSESSRTTTLTMNHMTHEVSMMTVDKSTHGAGHTENITGAIAGRVVAIVLAVLAVSLVSVWIIRHRRKNSKEKSKTASLSKDANHDTTYSLAGNIQQTNYHEIQDLGTHNSDYDYATADGMVLPPTTNTYFTIKPAGKLSLTGNATAGGDYDHIGDKPSQQTGDYDTTASLTQPGNIGENSYGYNHFDRIANPQTHQNDYDTAASATRAVAKITTTERNTDEDDYDHFHRGTNTPDTVSSPYDTTSGVEENSDYAVAGQMK